MGLLLSSVVMANFRRLSKLLFDSTRGSGPKNIKFSNGTYTKSDIPESINR